MTEKNYAQLNVLYEKYREAGLRILAFPCNQFGNQEAGTEADIKAFMAKRNVAFDAFSKIDVNGSTAHPLYKYLKSKQGGFLFMNAIKWNFTKFLVDKDGQPTQRYSPTTDPKDAEKDIIKLL